MSSRRTKWSRTSRQSIRSGEEGAPLLGDALAGLLFIDGQGLVHGDIGFTTAQTGRALPRRSKFERCLSTDRQAVVRSAGQAPRPAAPDCLAEAPARCL